MLEVVKANGLQRKDQVFDLPATVFEIHLKRIMLLVGWEPNFNQLK